MVTKFLRFTFLFLICAVLANQVVAADLCDDTKIAAKQIDLSLDNADFSDCAPDSNCNCHCHHGHFGFISFVNFSYIKIEIADRNIDPILHFFPQNSSQARPPKIVA